MLIVFGDSAAELENQVNFEGCKSQVFFYTKLKKLGFGLLVRDYGLNCNENRVVSFVA